MDKAKRLAGYFNFSKADAAWAYNVDSARFALINAEGRQLTPFIYENPEAFVEGAALAQINNQYVFLNEIGEVITEPLDFVTRTDRHLYFGGLVQKGAKGDEVNERWIGIKRLLNSIKVSTLESYQITETGIIKIKKNNLWGWIDSTGQTIIEPQFDNRAYFVQGRAWVQKNGKWGQIDSTGKVLLDFKYTDKKMVAFDTWRLEQNGRYGLYSSHFDISIPAEYEATGFIDEEFGWIRTKRNGKWGWVDKQGKVIIPFRYEAASPFVNGRAEVLLLPYPQFFWINKKGEMIVEAKE